MPGLTATAEATPAPIDQGSAFEGDAPVASALWLSDAAIIADGDGKVRRLERSGSGWAAGHTLQAHAGAILCAARHPDGRSIVTGGDDGRLMRVSPGVGSEELARFARCWVHDVAASAVSGVIVAAAGREAIVLRDGAAAVAHRFEQPSSVGGLALDPKGRRLAVAHYGGVSIWWALIADGSRQLMVWKGSHLAASWSPDGRFLVSAMQEAALHGWRVADKADMAMTGYSAKPRSVSWTPRGRHLLTSGAECVIAWPFTGKDGPMGKSPLELGPVGALVRRVAAHPVQDVHAAGYADGAVRLLRLPDGAGIVVKRPGAGQVTALAWSPNGNALLWGTEGGRFGVFAPGRAGSGMA